MTMEELIKYLDKFTPLVIAETVVGTVLTIGIFVFVIVMFIKMWKSIDDDFKKF